MQLFSLNKYAIYPVFTAVGKYKNKLAIRVGDKCNHDQVRDGRWNLHKRKGDFVIAFFFVSGEILFGPCRHIKSHMKTAFLL